MGSFLPESRPMTRPRSARDIPGGHRITIELDAGTEHVPGILLVPDAPPQGEAQFGAALLLHGFTSRKERMTEGIGRALLGRGMASLAIDLPLHGAREGNLESLSIRNPIQILGAWRLAVAEARHALDYLAGLQGVNPRRLAIVGYSLGAFLGVTVAANDPRVSALALAAGGDLPERTPFAALVRRVADPLGAIRGVAGRPLLMVNGRSDRTVTPAQAERLFAAAGEPKELYWYDGGHWPPPAVIGYAAEWLVRVTSDEWRVASAED